MGGSSDDGQAPFVSGASVTGSSTTGESRGAGGPSQRPFRKQLREIVDKRGLAAQDRVRSVLQISIDWFDLEVAVLSRIDLAGSVQRVIASAGDHPKFQEGTEEDLSETYCRRTATQSKPVMLENVEQQGWANRAYQTYGLSCYLGTKILVDEQLYGTVFLGGREPVTEPLGPKGEDVLRLIARSIENLLAQQRQPQTPDPTDWSGELRLDAAPAPIILADVETGRIVRVNRKAAELIGESEEAIVGRRQTGLHPSDEPTPYRDLFPEDGPSGEETRGHRVEEGLTYIETHQGGRVPVEVNVATVERSGRTLAVSVLRDATARNEAEEELRRARNFYDQILDKALKDIAVFNPEGKFEYVNPQSVEDPEMREWIVGHTNEQYCRKRNLAPEVGRRRDRAIQAAAREQRTIRFEEKIETEQGTRHYVRAHSPITNVEGDVTHVAAFGFDITERKKREQALQERQDKIEALYEATRRVLTAERQKEVSAFIHELLEEVFDYALRNTGFVEGEAILPEQTISRGTGLSSLEPQPKGGSSLSARALQTEDTVVVDDTRTLENDVEYGALRSVAAVPIGEQGIVIVGKTETGGFDPFNIRLVEILGSYAALVLGRLDREETLRRAKEEAEEAARLKSAMLANMSHEIRTPLTSIIGFAEALGEEVEEGETSSRFARLIEKSGRRLLDTLDGVLNLSTLEAGQMELEAQPVDLVGQARGVAEELRPQAEEKGVSVHVAANASPIRAEADAGGVQIILQNLLSNAIKYTEEGEVRLRVWREAEAVGLVVEDTGIGMDVGRAESLFEPFRQGSEGWDRAYEGTGLGLAVTKQAVDQMGGHIEVETEKGEGSRFTVWLPGNEGPPSEREEDLDD